MDIPPSKDRKCAHQSIE